MKIPLFEIFTDSQDIKTVKSVIKRGNFWAAGPEIEQFEKALCQFIGVKYAVVFNSGTSALHALLLAFNIGSGDEVIVPSFTFIATANAPLFVGAKPVFADIEDKTYGLDLNDVKRKITAKTKAIIIMHYAGNPCLYTQELRKLAKDHNLFLFEDAAGSFGARIRKKTVGTFGDGAILSFCQNKIITTGEGGAVVTNSKSVYHKLKLICSHGRFEKDNYFTSTKSGDYIDLGFNFRMASINAALGLAQLKKINKIINLRRLIAGKYREMLADNKKIRLLTEQDNFFNVYQMFPIQVEDNKRGKLKQYLKEKGIQTKVYFDPVHLTSFYRTKFGYQKNLLPITEKVALNILSIPIYPTITNKQIKYLLNSLQSF